MKTREQWLLERKQFLTASDVAAVLGIDGAFNNILDVYRDKTTDEVDESDSRILRHGRHMEPLTAIFYAEDTGREVRDPGATEIAVHPEIPWLGATLDREVLVDAGWYPLEIKQVNDPKHIFRMKEWESDPPGQYWVQCQMQAACKSVERCFLTAQFPGCQLANVDMEFDAEFFDMALPELDEFWNHNVVKRIPPEAPDHPKALASVKRLFSGRSRFTVVMSDEWRTMADEWDNLKAKAIDAGNDARRLEAKMRGQLGESRFGSLGDGTFLELSEVKRKGYTVEPKSYFEMRRKRR